MKPIIILLYPSDRLPPSKDIPDMKDMPPCKKCGSTTGGYLVISEGTGGKGGIQVWHGCNDCGWVYYSAGDSILKCLQLREQREVGHHPKLLTKGTGIIKGYRVFDNLPDEEEN